MVESHPFEAYEFFAGGGMLRAGLGDNWTCTFANDIDPQKAAFYRANWGGEELAVGDIGAITAADLPGQADLMWGSFPCQDLSLAGNGAGLGGARSGTFHAFWGLANELLREGRGPTIVAIENVCGALTSRGGRDFETLCRTWAEAGYAFGALVINADRFLPQSRPRLFVVGVRGDVEIDPALLANGPERPFHPDNLRRAVARLPADLRERTLWWRLPEPEAAPASLAELTETDGPHLEWHNQAQTARLLEMMSPVNRAKVEAVRTAADRQVGALFRRTRTDAAGRKVQRAEVRFDMAGCLRTPGGGSSRQTLVIVEHGRVRSRLMTARETARLMGLADSYTLPGSYSAACKLTGDGVAAPVVRHLARSLFEPLARARPKAARAA
ncbi:DNA cytosine methyltransferase [Brevundimonas sp. FT23042]|uniref:DNA cytosine methyltransferase n=1 Tax=Brevundimonas sp. FT23042 TaxID=3393749 RepID=UPI003B5862B6